MPTAVARAKAAGANAVAQDRPALLNQLAYALFQSKVTVHSAHVATYGERAVDTFYVTDLIGDKIDSAARVKSTTRGSGRVSGVYGICSTGVMPSLRSGKAGIGFVRGRARIR